MKIICIDARMIENAGIGSYIKCLLRNIDHEEHKIYLIINPKKINNSNKKDLKKFNLISVNAPIYSIKEQILLSYKIPKCDLFFSPHYNVPILPIRAKKRLVTIHDVYHLAFLSGLSFLEKLYAKFMINKAIRISDKILTVSNFSKNEILKYTRAKIEKIHVIHNAIDQKIFKKNFDEEMIMKVRQKFKLPEKYFLFVGNFKPHKNIINLLRFFKKILMTLN